MSGTWQGHGPDLSAPDRDCVTSIRPPVDAMTQWLRLAGTLAGSAAQTLPALPSSRRRQRLVVCRAARVLTALGVRVEVRVPAVAWPPPGTGRMVVANRVSWIDDLVLATAVRDARPVGAAGEATALLRKGATVLVHPEGTTPSEPGLGRFHPALFQPAVDAVRPVCPVAIRYRTELEDAPTAVPGNSPWHCLTRPIATRGLVVEVHLLPALTPTGADACGLAMLSEYAVGSVIAADPPRRAAEPRRSGQGASGTAVGVRP